MEQKMFVAYKRYEGDKHIIVLAYTDEEARQKAIAYFGLQGVTVRKLEPSKQDKQIYEI